MSSSAMASSSSSAGSTPSRPTKRRRLATEEITAEEAERRRIDASARLRTVWDDIIARYDKAADEDDADEDVIDWETMDIVEDRGAIRQLGVVSVGTFADTSGQREDTPSESEASTDDEVGLAALTTTLEPTVDEGEGAEVIDLCSTSEGEDDEVAESSSDEAQPAGPLTRARSSRLGTRPKPIWQKPAPVSYDSSDDEAPVQPIRRRPQSASRQRKQEPSPDPLAISTPVRAPVIVVVPSPRVSSPRPRSPAPAPSSGSDTSDYEDFISRLSPIQHRSTMTPPSSLASESPFAVPALPAKRLSSLRTLMPPPSLPAKLSSSSPLTPLKSLPTPSPSPSLRSAMRKPGAPPRLSLAPSPAPSSVRFASPTPSLRSEVSAIFDAPLRPPSPLKRLSPLRSDKGETFYEWPRSVSVELDTPGRSASITSDKAAEEADAPKDFDEILTPRRRPRSMSLARPITRAKSVYSMAPATVTTRSGSVTVSISPRRARSATVSRLSEVKTRAGTVTISSVGRSASSRPCTPSTTDRLRSLRSNSVAPHIYSRRPLPC